MKPIGAEVCVVGDGPSGVSAACRLARLGHQVVLVGDGVPRRRPVLESVSLGVHPLLDLLELKNALGVFAVECDPPEVRWETSEPSKHTSSSPSTYLVDRLKLQACLLGAARAAGVRIITAPTGCVPSRCLKRGWLVRLSKQDVVQANFLIVATGRNRLVSLGRKRIMPPLIALHSRWKLPCPARTRMSIEALRNGWLWWAPLGDGTCCAVAFMDPFLRNRDGRRDIESSYLAFLSQAAGFSKCFKGWRMSKVGACDASALFASEVIGNDWMLVGDSAVALEPISGQGIQTALKMGCQAAVVVHTCFADPSCATIAEKFYRTQCKAMAARHRLATRDFYRGPKRFRNEPFWIPRRSRNLRPSPRAPVYSIDAATRLRVSPDVKFRSRPCLIGDRIQLQAALDHPMLDGPVSHLGNVSLATLLREITEGRTVGELCHLWVRTGLADRPIALLNWLLRNGIVTPWEEFGGREVRGCASLTREGSIFCRQNNKHGNSASGRKRQRK